MQYYRGSYYGTPAAVMMHLMADKLNRVKNEMLWYAIVGFTEHFLFERMTRERYDFLLDAFRGEVLRLNKEESLSTETADGIKVPLAARGFIEETSELRLALLRHWNLYDSLMHTQQVATRLRVWTSAGKDKLDLLLARVGLPKFEAQQKYSCMSLKHRQLLDNELEDSASHLGVSGLQFKSFVRRENLQTIVSASDFVYAISALLETAPKTSASGTSLSLAAETAFWRAEEAMSKPSVLLEGIQAAINMQIAILSQASMLFQNQQLVSKGRFRSATINHSAWLTYFTKPLSLTRLGLFMLDVLKEGRRLPKPLVLAARTEATQSYLIVGIQPVPQVGTVARNRFSSAFANAAVRVKARFKHDGFESSWIEIHEDDITIFYDRLQLDMSRG
jgi:cell division control protein 45